MLKSLLLRTETYARHEFRTQLIPSASLLSAFCETPLLSSGERLVRRRLFVEKNIMIISIIKIKKLFYSTDNLTFYILSKLNIIFFK
jgi:hypothetical protein